MQQLCKYALTRIVLDMQICCICSLGSAHINGATECNRGHWIVSNALMSAAMVDWVWLTHRTVQTGFIVGGSGEQKQTSSS